jgi:hypothetical protein
MKNSLRFLALAALAAIPFAGRAQVTYTTYTSSDTSIGNFPVGSIFYTSIQTFTGFSSLSDMTWTLTNTAGSSQTATFNAYVAQWNSGSSTVVGPLTAFGTVGNSLTLGGGGVGSLSFTGSLSLNPVQTYALIVSYASGDQTFATSVGTNPGGAFFSSGNAVLVQTSSDLVSFLTDLQSQSPSNAFDLGGDTAYTMSVTAGLAGTPVPEPKTAAAGIAAMFVAALVGRRVWQRNKLTPVPLAA